MSGFLAAWGLVAQRSVANWKMVAILAFGVLVAATLLASAPIYARSMADLGVTFAVREDLADDPSISAVLPATALQTADGLAARQAVEARIDERLGWYQADRSRRLTAAHFILSRDGSAEPDQRDPLALLMSATGYEAHVDVVEGRLPQPTGPDEPIELAVAARIAALGDITPGTQLVLVEAFDTCQRIIPEDFGPPPPPCDPTAAVRFTLPAVVTGIIEPTNPDASFWAPTSRLFFDARQGVPGSGPIIPFFAHERGIVEGLGGRYPGYQATAEWTILADPEALTRNNFDRARDDIRGLHEDLRSLGGAAYSALTTVLDDFGRSEQYQQVPLLVLLLQIAGIAFFYTGIVATIVVERQASEIALLRSRGASTWQVLGVYAIEGLTVGVPAMLVAPFLAGAATAALGLTPIFHEVSDGDLLPVTIVPSSFALAAAGVLISLGTLLLPAFIVARRGALATRRLLSRPGASFIHRYYLDLALVVFAGLLLWELNERGSIFEPSATGGVTSDPILLASPALIILAAAALVTRFFPLVLRGIELIVRRMPGVTVSMGVWQLVRSPGQYTRLTLLLMMAVAVGTFAASYTATANRSYQDRARFEAGVDVRGTTRSPFGITGNVEQVETSAAELPGVEKAAAVIRTSGTQASASGTGGPSVQVLAIDQTAAAMLWSRGDFANEPFDELLAKLGGPARLGGKTMPESAAGLRIWLSTDRARPDVTVWARVRDDAGRHALVEFGKLDFEGQWVQREARFDSPSTRGMEAPLTLVAIVLTQPANSFNPTTDPLYLDDITAFDAEGRETVVEDFEAGVRWEAVPSRTAFQDEFAVSDERAHSGQLAARLGFRLGATGGRRGIYLADENIPLPAVASTAFLARAGIEVGSTTLLDIGGSLVPVAIRGSYELFPTIESRQGPSIVLNRDMVMSWADTFTFVQGELHRVNEVWFDLEDGADREAFAAAARQRFGLQNIVDVEERLRSIETNPLIAASGTGILMLAFLSILVLVGVALLVSLWMAVQRRRVEFAVLRALGLSRWQILGQLTLEYAVVAVLGLATGTYLGQVVGRRMLSFLDVTETGLPVEPSFVLETDWGLVAGGLAAVVAIFVIALAAAVRVLARTSDAAALRTE
ncbi:MAG: ABC transporter permease [Dehalococcoidia bacterium]